MPGSCRDPVRSEGAGMVIAAAVLVGGWPAAVFGLLLPRLAGARRWPGGVRPTGDVSAVCCFRAVTPLPAIRSAAA